MYFIAYVVNQLISLYVIVIFVSVVLSWLISFNIINRHNQFVDMIWRFTTSATEPALRPIRRFLPNLGGIDISPIILLVGLNATRGALNHYIFNPAIGNGL